MNTKRTLFLAIAIASLLGTQPMQAQVGQLPSAGAHYVAPSSVVAGKTFESELVVWSLIPAQFSAPKAEVLCTKGDASLSGDATGITGLNSGEANTTPFERPTIAYVPPSLAGFTCTVTSQISFGGDAQFMARFTIEVLPAAFGSIHATNESNEVVSASNHRFAITLHSNDGDVQFGTTSAHLDCGPQFADDYVIQSPSDPGIAQVLYFFAGMPATTAPLTCTWTGTFIADGETYQLLDTPFTVIPHSIGLPLVIR